MGGGTGKWFRNFINDFDDIDLMTIAIRDAIGYKFEQDQDQLKVTNIRAKISSAIRLAGFPGYKCYNNYYPDAAGSRI